MFGLRPISRAEEGEIVKGWLEREEHRGLAVGQLWYLISMDWWRIWNDYVSNNSKVQLNKYVIQFFYILTSKLFVLEWL